MSQQQVDQKTSLGDIRRESIPSVTPILAPYRLAELLIKIGERRLTGRLVLQSDVNARTIFFHSGLPVFAQSTQFAERLGAVAIRYGVLQREDIAQALILSRQQGGELGKALLELGSIDGSHLFTLLGTQLTERIAASCSNAYTRVHFKQESEALDKTIILRLHPMTAILTAVRNMQPKERTGILEAIGSYQVSSFSISPLVKQWLNDIGYIGDVDALLSTDNLTIADVHSRMVTLTKPDSLQLFDPRQAPYAYLLGRKEIEIQTSSSVADLMTISFLLAGCLNFSNSEAATSQISSQSLPNTVDLIHANLSYDNSKPLPSLPDSDPKTPQTHYDWAIHTYLFGKREESIAARMAIWGPGVETEENEELNQLLTLYLTLKQDFNPRSVLAVENSDTDNDIKHTYKLYSEFLNASLEVSKEPLVLSKVAELQLCIDNAIRSLIPNPESFIKAETSSTFLSEQESEFFDTSKDKSNLATNEQEDLSAESTSTSNNVSFKPATTEGLSEEGLSDLSIKIESLIQSHAWQRVCDILSQLSKSERLPPMLSLAHMVAQQELREKKAKALLMRETILLLFLVLLLGIFIGYMMDKVHLLDKLLIWL